MKLNETTVALLLSEEGRQVLQSAAVNLAEDAFLLVFVKESDEIGMWIRVGREDGDHLLLIRWEYVLSMDVPEGTPKIRIEVISDAPRDHYDAVRRVQRAELFDDQEPQNDARPAGAEEVLPAVPQAYAA